MLAYCKQNSYIHNGFGGKTYGHVEARISGFIASIRTDSTGVGQYHGAHSAFERLFSGRPGSLQTHSAVCDGQYHPSSWTSVSPYADLLVARLIVWSS